MAVHPYPRNRNVKRLFHIHGNRVSFLYAVLCIGGSVCFSRAQDSSLGSSGVPHGGSEVAAPGGDTSGASEEKTKWGSSRSEQTGQFLADPAKWRWPARNAPGVEKTVHATLLKWCGSAYKEAISDAGEKSRTFQRLRAERAQRHNEWMHCQQERALMEQEVETECKNAKNLQQSEMDRDREILQLECDAQTQMFKAELEACELKLTTKEAAVCKREVEIEKAACRHTIRGLEANLTACQQKDKMGNPRRVIQLEHTAATFYRDKETWTTERVTLMDELAACRPARAHTEARLREILADGTTNRLEQTALWLQVVVGVLVLALIILLGTMAWLSANEERPTGSGSFGWVGAQSAAKMRLVAPEAARGLLEDAFEGRTLSRLPVVLTTAVMPEGESGVPVVFLLVPVNVASSRRFSLFNSGGDYVSHVERAREIVSKAFERGRLVVVLYEGHGSLFSEKTLQSLRLNPDKVAYEAVPKDMDFPKSHNLVVPWMDKALGVRATDSERESDLTGTIKLQPWAQYLLLRSGRWGAAHAQL